MKSVLASIEPNAPALPASTLIHRFRNVVPAVRSGYLWYVAGTRAKEHLILIGSAGESCLQEWDDARRYNDEARIIVEDTLRFRHRLIPYLYTMNARSASDEAISYYIVIFF